ncbi:protein kinase domain-containing protein [Antrihabitans stalactiti]|uniref:protein kinase domain-containing protein n=1 Tax=Antrihabitans stalactiti TaxID=2584121 RepID=UPI001F0F37FB|nr:protein kinase [Antrihabitans stalactiti]
MSTDVNAVLSQRGSMAPQRAASIIEQIARALDAAHVQGLVHRDIKSSNMLVAAHDFVYLIDFGIARATGETSLTSTGTAVGTFAYMAPDRFQTGVADTRCGVYSLACVLRECLTGATTIRGNRHQTAGRRAPDGSTAPTSPTPVNANP